MPEHEKPEASKSSSSSATTPAQRELQWVRKFIEYARYELQPGESQMGDQFPRQADADRAIAILDALLAAPAPAAQGAIERRTK